MSTWSRRDALRLSAGAAAVAVPMSTLSRPAGVAGAAGDDGGDDTDVELDGQPVMFCVHDAEAGEVSILHGEDEVVVRDRALVNRILRAASAHRS